jgi:predicted phosphodiesterase
MRIALLSDVHGNLPAFEAVLTDIESAGAEQLWCLGDLVGYGAQPDECVALARERCTLSLAGNHDLVVTGEIPISDFSSSAAAAALWTQEVISEESLSFLRGLAASEPTREPGLFHGSPRDPVWEYVLSSWQADECMDLMEARVGAIGHSHVALWFHRADDGELNGAQAAAGAEQDVSEGKWLLNPGGVGQPRDGDPRAAWLLLDTGDWAATWRRVEYPIEMAARAIEDAGLPGVLAERLYSGH